MATTRLISMHKNKGKSTAKCLADRIDYALNPDKTNNGEYVSSYECDPKTILGKPITHSEKLRNTIDEILSKNPTDFDVFISQMEHAGYSIKQGKYLAFKSNDQKKFIRLRSLGEGYTEEEIRAVINEEKPFANRKRATVKSQSSVNFLVDIQAKLQAGKGAGYERWAKILNLKQMAQTMNYLTENNLLDYKDLEKKAQTITDNFNQLSIQIKDAEKRMAEIGNLKTHIINYSKTRDTYTAYRKAGYSKKFYEEHTAELLLHKAAKAAFDEIEGKKLPTVKSLQTEYSVLLSEKKKAYTKYHSIKKEMKNILTAKENVDRLLGEDILEKEKEKHKEQR